MGINMLSHAAGGGDVVDEGFHGAPAVGGSEWIKRNLMGSIGANPEDIPAPTKGARLLRSVSGGVAGALAPAGEGLTIGRMLTNGMIGAGSGAASDIAQEVVPEKYKTIAGFLAGLAGGLGVAGAEGAVRAAARATGDVVSPLAAAVSPEAARQQAGRVLSQRAADPAAVQREVAGRADEIVPGSKPTTFQQTGDMGLGALEREQSTKNPVPFRDRDAAQNAARTAQLEDIQSGGDPNALATGIRNNFDHLEATTQADLDRLTEAQAAEAAHTAASGESAVADQTQTAQERAAGLGGVRTPEAYGESTRAMVNEAEASARARESGLWNAVDPHGDLTGNTAPTASAARDIQASLPKTAKPMTGEEAGIFNAASELPPLSPVQDLIALRSRVSTELRNELIANGRSPAYARLAQLRGAIQDNLGSTISQVVANDAAAANRGAINTADTAAARIQAWIDDYKAQRAAEAVSNGRSGPGGAPLGGSPASPGDDGAVVPPSGGPGGIEGDQGLQGSAPTFDDAAAQRLAAATEATKARARVFGLNPISPVTAKAGSADLFRLPDGRVPEKFFHPGPTGYSDMQALFSAVGEQNALPVMTDYAASSLRRAAMREDGMIDPAKYSRWVANHADALRALPPEARARFAGAAAAAKEVGATAKTVARANAEAAKTAANTVTAAAAARMATLKGFREGAIGRVMGLAHPEDVTRTIGRIFGSRTAVSEMKILADAARKAGPDAVEGLRQAIADHITTRLIGNTEVATSGISQIKADALQTFVRQNRAVLKPVFTDKEIGVMDAVAKDIQRAKRSQNAVRLPGGSNTAQDITAVRKGSRGAVVKTVLDSLAAVSGFALHGPIGALSAAMGAHALQSMRESGLSRVDELITEALLHPEVARELLKAAPARGAPSAGRGLALALQRVTRASLGAASTNH